MTDNESNALPTALGRHSIHISTLVYRTCILNRFNLKLHIYTVPLLLTGLHSVLSIHRRINIISTQAKY